MRAIATLVSNPVSRGYCGFVNAKSKSGAFGGFAPFAATITAGVAHVLTPDLKGEEAMIVRARVETYGCLKR